MFKDALSDTGLALVVRPRHNACVDDPCDTKEARKSEDPLDEREHVATLSQDVNCGENCVEHANYTQTETCNEAHAVPSTHVYVRA